MSQERSFTSNLEQVSLVRHELANQIEEMMALLIEAEAKGEKASGKLSLDREIKQLQATCNNLRHSKFRLLVLGDMKRGKSTFINALVGEKLLPSDVNPCTALPTILRYGAEKQVTVYFKDGSSRTIDLAKFQQKYTIKPNEAKVLAERNQLAFPNVDYAAIEYPLPLLKKGLEIIDSPGLNDTEARNELTLQHVYNCHAVLFLFKAVQPCTLNERRYLKNYLLGRDLTVFFIINAWDEIKQGLVDPEDSEELRLAYP
ncbi:dynamin family protein [Pleurocapsales cyanobacterium LEGE 10410]|nr:dynamin family protein [Pleurocapsales cyanobacterium LEGE 10410]